MRDRQNNLGTNRDEIRYQDLEIEYIEQVIPFFISLIQAIKECHQKGEILVGLQQDDISYNRITGKCSLARRVSAGQGEPISSECLITEEQLDDYLEIYSYAPECYYTEMDKPSLADEKMDIYSLGWVMENLFEMVLQVGYLDYPELMELIKRCQKEAPRERIGLDELAVNLIDLMPKKNSEQQHAFLKEIYPNTLLKLNDVDLPIFPLIPGSKYQDLVVDNEQDLIECMISGVRALSDLNQKEYIFIKINPARIFYHEASKTTYFEAGSDFELKKKEEVLSSEIFKLEETRAEYTDSENTVYAPECYYFENESPSLVDEKMDVYAFSLLIDTLFNDVVERSPDLSKLLELCRQQNPQRRPSLANLEDYLLELLPNEKAQRKSDFLKTVYPDLQLVQEGETNMLPGTLYRDLLMDDKQEIIEYILEALYALKLCHEKGYVIVDFNAGNIRYDDFSHKAYLEGGTQITKIKEPISASFRRSAVDMEDKEVGIEYAPECYYTDTPPLAKETMDIYSFGATMVGLFEVESFPELNNLLERCQKEDPGYRISFNELEKELIDLLPNPKYYAANWTIKQMAEGIRAMEVNFDRISPLTFETISQRCNELMNQLRDCQCHPELLEAYDVLHIAHDRHPTNIVDAVKEKENEINKKVNQLRLAIVTESMEDLGLFGKKRKADDDTDSYPNKKIKFSPQ